jgi:lipopolysaccharide export system permease protein
LRSVQNEYATGDALWFVALTIPRMAYQIFPVSALLGALVGVGGMAASNELVAFRTSGVSRVRLAAAALGGTLVLTVPVLIMGEWVAPAAEHQARAFRLSEMVGQAIVGGPRGVWLRDGRDIVNIQLPLLSADRGEQSVAFNDVVIYSFSEQVDLKTITRAASAAHSGDTWTLNGVTEVQFDPDGARVSRSETKVWATEVRPELLDSAVTRPQRLSLRSLVDYLAYMRENGLDASVYEAALWEKIVFPFTVIALVLAGMPFVFGSARSQNLGVRLFFGMILGGLFMIVNRMVQNFGDAYHLPALLSYLLPSLLLAIGAIFALRRTV